MRSRQIIIAVVSILIFACLYCWWIRKAADRPLENDELYSQTSSIDHQTYLSMLSAKIEEGNNTPLFYALQKTIFNG